MKKILILLSAIAILNACSKIKTKATENTPYEPVILGYDENCQGEATQTELRKSKWHYQGESQQLALEFLASEIKVRYTCSVEIEGHYYSESDDQIWDYVTNSFRSSVLILNPTNLHVHVPQSSTTCEFNLDNVLDYYFSGSCMALVKDNGDTIYLEAN